MNDLFDLTGKYALVVGGGSGIGLQLSEALARQGASIAIADIVEDRLRPAADQVAEIGAETFTCVCDVTDPDSVRDMVSAVHNRFGRIDILVNCPGISISYRSDRLYDDAWKQVMDVNLNGMFYVCREVGKIMIEQRYGKIVNLASGYAECVPPNWMWPLTAYCSSKGGVKMLTKALAVEWAPYGITVNAIGPGYFKTNLTKDSIDNEQMKRLIHTLNPMDRYGREGELDGTCILLASDASSYLSGQLIRVDGGASCI